MYKDEKVVRLTFDSAQLLPTYFVNLVFLCLELQSLKNFLYPYSWALFLPLLPAIFADLSNLHVCFLATICQKFYALIASAN